MTLQVRKIGSTRTSAAGRRATSSLTVGSVRVALPFMDHLSVEMRRALGLADGGTDMQGFIPQPPTRLCSGGCKGRGSARQIYPQCR